ncbi:hypothetical protein SUNI508_00421 [Seiridium unicorne]|uniref:Uncharacterized protein n=1 Tax=Seiridium unicorne TaxID=138068 RepID=A0ABR2V6N2_9PEZI
MTKSTLTNSKYQMLSDISRHLHPYQYCRQVRQIRRCILLVQKQPAPTSVVPHIARSASSPAENSPLVNEILPANTPCIEFPHSTSPDIGAVTVVEQESSLTDEVMGDIPPKQLGQSIGVENSLALPSVQMSEMSHTARYLCENPSDGDLLGPTDSVCRQAECVSDIHPKPPLGTSGAPETQLEVPFPSGSSLDISPTPQLEEGNNQQNMPQSDLHNEDDRTRNEPPTARRNLRTRPVALPQTYRPPSDLSLISDDDGTDELEDEDDKDDYAQQPQRKRRRRLSGFKAQNKRHNGPSGVGRCSDRHNISTPSSQAQHNKENTAGSPTAVFEEWPLQDAVLKRITENC